MDNISLSSLSDEFGEGGMNPVRHFFDYIPAGRGGKRYSQCGLEFGHAIEG